MEPYLLFLDSEDQNEENTGTLPSIEKLIQSGQKIEIYTIPRMYECYVLPFLRSPDGMRYYGADSIRGYVNKLNLNK